MDKDVAALFSLPWATLLTLASGYAGYFIANTGLRAHHKAVDVAFSTLVFGFFGTFVYQLLIRLQLSITWASLAAFLAAVIIGAIWRRAGRSCLEWALRTSHTSYADDMPNAWTTIFKTQNATMRQITVKLTNGSMLHCDDLRKFASKPCGPCVLGEAGDICLYVTHQKLADEENFSQIEDLDNAWGTLLTFVPKDQISVIDMRFKLR